MPLPNMLGHYRTYSRFTNLSSGNPFSLTMDYRDEDLTEFNPTALALAVVEAWSDLYASIIDGFETYADYIHTDVDLVEVEAVPLGTLDAPGFALGDNSTKGKATATPMPPDVALVASKRTALRGRANRGRMYLGGFTTLSVGADGRLDMPNVATRVDTSFRRIGTTVDEGWQMVVISQASVPSGTSTDVLKMTVDSNWDTQRRRGR